MKHLIGMLIMALLIASSASLHAEQAGSAGDLIAKGDAAYKKFDNDAALEFYQKGLETDPQNYEAAWKLARAYVDVGEKLPDKKDRRSNYEKAHGYARKAVEISPDGAKGHLFLSIAIGRVALDAGAKETLQRPFKGMQRR